MKEEDTVRTATAEGLARGMVGGWSGSMRKGQTGRFQLIDRLGFKIYLLRTIYNDPHSPHTH